MHAGNSCPIAAARPAAGNIAGCMRAASQYSPGDALNAILNYWVEELRMNYVALAIALG